MKTLPLIEQHFHGAYGVDFNKAGVKDIVLLSQKLRDLGIAGFFPTLVTDTIENTKQQINVIKQASKECDGILGIHLEGIFLNPLKNGIHNIEHFLKLTIENYKKLEDDFIKIVTLAPELDKGLIKYLKSKNIKVQAGDCVGWSTNDKLDGATHLFNAMSRMHHRDPGTVGAVFIHPELSCEIIADGIHINPEIIKFLLTCKSLDKVVLVTDALKPTKQHGKHLIANGEPVYLDRCFYRRSDDAIAGSALTLLDSVRNIVSYGMHLEQAVHMASTNPARIMKQDHLGVIAPGYDADICVLSGKLNLLYTIVQGKIYSKGKMLCV